MTTTNKYGTVNQQPLYCCTSCYEHCTWPAGDLRVYGNECWCDLCWDDVRRDDFPDQPQWADLKPYTPVEQQPAPDVTALVEALEDIAGTHHHSASAGEYFAKVARAALAAYRKQGGGA